MKGISEEELFELEEGARNSVSSERDTYLRTSSFQTDFSLPEDDPLLWSLEEQVKAETLASLFTAEYVFDWDARAALLRMGATFDDAKLNASRYLRHSMVQRFLRRRKQRFFAQNATTVETVLSLMSQDASDFSPFSNPLARTKAQALLWQALMDLKKLEMLDDPERNPSAQRQAANNSGGVLVVPGIMDTNEWEKIASESQDALIA